MLVLRVVLHVLSIELQLYFEKITDLTVSRSNSIIFNKALLSLATDAGLHPLVPYFIYFVAEEVKSLRPWAANRRDLMIVIGRPPPLLYASLFSHTDHRRLHLQPHRPPSATSPATPPPTASLAIPTSTQVDSLSQFMRVFPPFLGLMLHFQKLVSPLENSKRQEIKFGYRYKVLI